MKWFLKVLKQYSDFSTRARRVAHDGKMWVAAGGGKDYSLADLDKGTTWPGISHSKKKFFHSNL